MSLNFLPKRCLQTFGVFITPLSVAQEGRAQLPNVTGIRFVTGAALLKNEHYPMAGVVTQINLRARAFRQPKSKLF
jgi:hypothetical protein